MSRRGRPARAWDAALSYPEQHPEGAPPEPPAMASLLAKDAYLQSLARKICSRPSPEPHPRKSGKAQPAGPGGLRKGVPPPCAACTAPRGAVGWARHVCA